MEEAVQIEQRANAVQKSIAPQMSIGGWFITFILLAVPFVNIILLFVWAMDANSERRNFSRAYLMMIGIMLVISIIISIAIFALGASSGIFG